MQRKKFIVLVFIVFFILTIAFESIIGTPIGRMIFKAVLESTIFAVIFYLLYPQFSTKLTTNLLEQLKPRLTDNEELILHTPASFRNSAFNSIGGLLILTNKRLIFKAHKLNISKADIEVGIGDIVGYKARNENTIELYTNSNRANQKYIVENPSNWISYLALLTK